MAILGYKSLYTPLGCAPDDWHNWVPPQCI